MAIFNDLYSVKAALKLPLYDIRNYPIKILCLLAGVLVYVSVSGQTQHERKIDSLKTIINSSAGAQKVDALINLVRVYASFDNAAAMEFALEASQISSELGDTSRYVTSTRMVAQLYNRLWKYDNAEPILLKLKPIAERNNLRNELKYIYGQLAIDYTYNASYDKALQANFEALELREADNEMDEVATLLNNIGLVYFKIRNYQKALEFYNNSVDIRERINSRTDLDRTLINIGLCYNDLLDFEKALEYFRRGMEICGQDCKKDILVEGNFGLGTAFFSVKQLDSAEARFKKSLEVAAQIGYTGFEAENHLKLAILNRTLKKFNEADIELAEAEKTAKKHKYTQILIHIYQEYAIRYNAVSDFRNAALYQGKYIALQDSIYSAELIDNLAKIQTDYAERENIKTIASKDDEIQRQRVLTLAIVVIAILAGALVFVLYRSNQSKKKANNALSEAKAIIEEQNKLLTSSNIILDKELKERNIDLEKANVSLRQVNDELDNFIYKTSHDIRGPLASLKGMCNVALIDVQDPIALDYLHKLDVTADKMNTILTRLMIVNQINNSVVGYEQIDFTEIINDVLLLEKKKGFPPDFAILRDVAENIEFRSDHEFIRIILENLIDNAIKFYNDSGQVKPFVKISIHIVGNGLVMKVIDNGIGISKVDPSQIFHMFSRASERSETGGIGLYITKTAVEKLGGNIELRTNKDGHTEFKIWLPLQPAKVMA